jgi:hypothetical protein
MTRFSDLTNPLPGELPGDAQRRARGAFPASVAASRLEHWTPGIERSAPRVLVVGIGVWSRYDLRLLDLLDETLSTSAPDIRVAVFDIDTSLSADELERRLPGQGRPHHTPVVGYWKDGEFAASDSGYPARQLVYRVLALDPQTADQFIAPVRTSSTV